jgi:hypothetical protein
MEEKIPEMECVEVGSFAEQMNYMQKMSELQRTHNLLVKDIETLVAITNEHFHDQERIQPLIRACIKELFSLIEADLFLINQFNPYPDYRERDDLGRKFKKTYRHHATTFKKEDIQKAFQSKFYSKLYTLKWKRDELMHPKGRHSIEVNSSDLITVGEVYETYRQFVSTLMTNVGVSIKIPIEDFLSGRFKFQG